VRGKAIAQQQGAAPSTPPPVRFRQQRFLRPTIRRADDTPAPY
jgi:hypothetical protein